MTNRRISRRSLSAARRGRVLTARRVAFPVVALTALTAACGGSSTESGATTTQPAAPAADEAAGQEASAGEPAGDATATAGGEVELTEFCRTSAEFYVTISALDYLSTEDDSGARQIYNAVPVQLDAAIAAAETPEEASEPQRMKASLTLLTAALDEVNWDVDQLPNLPNAPEIGNALMEVGESTSRLGTYLDQTCELDLSRLSESAIDVANSVASQPLVTPSAGNDAPAEAAPPAEPQQAAPLETKPGSADPSTAPFPLGEATDATGLIRTRVPAGWNQVDGSSDGAVRQLVAAEDLGAFLAGFSLPGVSIVSGSVDDGALAANNGFDALAGSLGNAGCTVGAEAPYADGVYSGRQVTAVCNTEGTPTYVISGSNAANDVFFLVIMAEGPNYAGVYDVVTGSFRVD